MTTEEKAKAYDEALEHAKFYHGNCPSEPERKKLERMFPVLRESEDERIRKEILEFFENYRNNGTWKTIPDVSKYIVYLEKQKGNVEKEYVFRPLAGTDITDAAKQAIRRANEGNCLVLAFNGAYIPVKKGCNASEIVDIYDAYLEKQKELPLMNGDADLYFDEWNRQKQNPTKRECFEEGMRYADRLQKEQKPAEWSEEDERMLSRCIKSIECSKQFSDSQTFIEAKDKEIDWLKNRVFTIKQEWSEEDKQALQFSIDWLDTYRDRHAMTQDAKDDITFCIEKLKTLRPQPNWKPSEKQINMLGVIVEREKEKLLYGIDGYSPAAVLGSLYNDLKQLM